MKSITFLTSVLLLLAFFWACSPNVEEGSSNIAVNPECDPQGGFIIDKDSATTFITAYQEYLDEVKDTLETEYSDQFPNTETELIYGAHVNLLELRAILNGANCIKDSLWIMMATIPPYTLSNQTAVPQSELIFALKKHSMEPKSKATEIKSIAAEPWTYYDFTAPCPTFCPY